MRILSTILGILLLAGTAFGQGQFSGGGNGNTTVGGVAIPAGQETIGTGTQVQGVSNTISGSGYCGAAGFGAYSSALTSPGCTGSYDNVHQIGHGMCEAWTQAALANPNAKIDMSGFSGTQFITSNCGVLLTYGGATSPTPPGGTINGRTRLSTNIAFLVDGPTTLPFFTDNANCGTAACTTGNGTTSGPSTWGTPAFILANQYTGFFDGSLDGTIFIPCATTVTGCVHDWPLRSFPITSTTVATNTMTITVAANSFLAGGQNGAGANPSAPITGFSGTSGTLSFTNTGTNNFFAGFSAILFGFTAPNTALNGQSCVISATGLTATTFQCPVTGSGYSSGTGFISEANIWPTGGGLTGEYGFLVGSSVDGNNAAYIIKTVPTNGTVTVQVPTGTASCASNCGTLYLGTAMFGWGMQIQNMAYIPQQGCSGCQSFKQRLEDLAVWGESTQIPQGKTWPYGFIAYQNDNAGEGAGTNHTQAFYIAGMGLDLHGGSTDSYYNDFRQTNLANNNAVRSSTGVGLAGAARGVYNSSIILPYPTGAITTSNGVLGSCAANCAQVSGTGADTFATVVPNTQMIVQGSTCPSLVCTVASVQSSTILTFTSAPGGASTSFAYGQPLACFLIDGQGPTVNQSPVLQANHPEGCADGFRLAGNYTVRGMSILGFLGGPNGAHADLNLVHAVAAGNSVLGSNVTSIDTQNGGSVTTVLDDINGNTVLDLPMNWYSWDPKGYPYYSAINGTFTNGVNTVNGYSHSLAATQTLAATSGAISATTASGGISSGAGNGLTWTYGAAPTTFVPNTTYKLHCTGTTTQSTAGAGIGISFQTPGTATPIELHAIVGTSTTTVQVGSSGLVTATTATALYTGATGSTVANLPFTIDGTIAVGATPPTSLKLGFFTIVGADTITVNQGSTCDLR